MITVNVSNRKSFAGNPHVRFNGGEAVSAMPKRNVIGKESIAQSGTSNQYVRFENRNDASETSRCWTQVCKKWSVALLVAGAMFGVLGEEEWGWLREGAGGVATITGHWGTYPNEVDIPATITCRIWNDETGNYDDVLCTVRAIENLGFGASDENVTAVHLPDTLEVIGAGVFEQSKITEIHFPASVKTVAAGAFHGSHLRRVEWPSTMSAIPAGCFALCDYLQEVVLPDSVTVIGANAFWGSISLKTMNMPSSLQVIGTGALRETGFEEIVLPSSVRTIGSTAFCWCESLTKLTLNEGLEFVGEEIIAEAALKTALGEKEAE